MGFADAIREMCGDNRSAITGDMLDRVRTDIGVARYLYRTYLYDNGVIFTVAFCIQQSAEKFIRYNYELQCIECSDSHNISTLLKDIDFKGKDELLAIADTISDWESMFRYTEGKLLEFDTVKHCLEVVERVVASFKDCDRFSPEKWFAGLSDKQMKKLIYTDVAVYYACSRKDYDGTITDAIHKVRRENPDLR